MWWPESTARPVTPGAHARQIPSGSPRPQNHLADVDALVDEALEDAHATIQPERSVAGTKAATRHTP
jgi:hypothetical protein